MNSKKTSSAKDFQAEALHYNEVYYRQCVEVVDYLKEKFGEFRPQAWVVLGSGLGGLSESSKLKVKDRIPYIRIPHFPRTGVSGHSGVLVAAQVGKRRRPK